MKWFDLFRDGFGLGFLCFILLTFSGIFHNGQICWSEPRPYIFWSEIVLFFIGGYMIIKSILNNLFTKENN